MCSDTTRKRHISLVAEELDSQRLVIFVGAGCSISAGLPSWKELIDDILRKYSIKTKETHLIRLATRLERELSPLKFREEISKRLRLKPETATHLHDELVSLDVNLFVTTNYDHLLDDAFKKYGHSPRIVYKDEDLPSIDPTQKTIVKLHGDIDSPSSLVITSTDYARYKTRHRGFVDWLRGTLSRYSILFLGTSFDDPRVVEVDDDVVNLFDSFRRSPFIVLKAPAPSSENEDSYKIELSDFEAMKEDFHDRGFLVISVQDYSEVQGIIKDIRTEAIGRKLRRDPSDLETRYLLQSDRLGNLEKELTHLLDQKTLELCQSVRTRGQFPTLGILQERVETLIRHLEERKDGLSLESQMEGWLTATDAFLVSAKKTDVIRARRLYEKADSAFRKIPDPESGKNDKRGSGQSCCSVKEESKKHFHL